MNALLFGVGAALLAAPFTIFVQGGDNLLVVIARRVGFIGLIGLIGAGVQFLGHQPLPAGTPLVDRVLWLVQAVPANAGGWLAHAIHNALLKPDASVAAHPDAFIAIALGVVVLAATFMALRKERSEFGIAPVNILLTGVVIINMVVGTSVRWW